MQPLRHKLRNDDQICFLHIPKTAGTTLSSILEAQFAKHEICTFSSWTDIPYGPPDLGTYRLIKGHIFYDIWKILPKKPFYMTLLRDPIERTLSQFEMLRRSPGYIHYDRIKYMSFSEYINDPDMAEFYVNVQTRMIASIFDIKTSRDINGAKEQVNENSLQIAKERINQFAFIGLTERMEDSIRILCYTLGCKPRLRFQNLNVSPIGRLRQEDIPSTTLGLLKERIQLDTELYRHAQDLFEIRLVQMIDNLLEEDYERSFTLIDTPAAQTIEYKFDDALSGTSWHEREYHPTHGYFRWTGPDTRSTLDLRLATSQDLIIEFRVIAALAPDILDSLALCANDQFVPLQRRTDVETGTDLFTGVIPQGALTLRHFFIRLGFQINRTVAPYTIESNNPDQRQLGIALNLIRICPVSRPEGTNEVIPYSPDSREIDMLSGISTSILRTSQQTSYHSIVREPNELVPLWNRRPTNVTTERVIEVPWALMQLPQSGVILDVGSCDATYLSLIQQPDRILHCLDPRECPVAAPPGAMLHHQNLIGNDLPRNYFDAVLLLSTLEHIGLPCYGHSPFPDGDRLALAEAWDLLKLGCPVIATVPVGLGKVVSWYRQYTPTLLDTLFKRWKTEISYWGYDGAGYRPITADKVERYDYRENAGAGAVAGIVAYRAA
jgi:hypothetical protein